MDYTKVYNEELIILVKEKIKSVGEVKAVKFVREQTGLSLIQAKKFVDFCKEQIQKLLNETTPAKYQYLVGVFN